jgi:hypothetical protein
LNKIEQLHVVARQCVTEDLESETSCGEAARKPQRSNSHRGRIMELKQGCIANQIREDSRHFVIEIDMRKTGRSMNEQLRK